MYSNWHAFFIHGIYLFLWVFILTLHGFAGDALNYGLWSLDPNDIFIWELGGLLLSLDYFVFASKLVVALPYASLGFPIEIIACLSIGLLDLWFLLNMIKNLVNTLGRHT